MTTPTVARVLRSGLAVVLMGLGACATGGEVRTDATNVDPVPSTNPHDGGVQEILAVWTMSAGECPECAFTGTFMTNGTLLWSSGFGGSVVEFDPTDALAAAGALTVDALTDGTDDCMPELDGNAPSLVVRDRDSQVQKIDTCYWELNEDHPFAKLTMEPVEHARGEAVPFIGVVATPDGPCESNASETCPATVHEVYADGLILVTTPSTLVDDAAIPTASQRVDQRLVSELGAEIDGAVGSRAELCERDTGSDETEAERDPADGQRPLLWIDSRYPGRSTTFGDMLECTFDPTHPAPQIVDEIKDAA